MDELASPVWILAPLRTCAQASVRPLRMISATRLERNAITAADFFLLASAGACTHINYWRSDGSGIDDGKEGL